MYKDIEQVTGVQSQYASISFPTGTPPIRSILGGTLYNTVGAPTVLSVTSSTTPGAAEVYLASRGAYALGITAVTLDHVALKVVPYGFRPEPIQSVERTT